MLYLYKAGYRNFLFFVNLTNILEKTKENFLNATSKKYLFAEEIVIDGEKVKINVVENFQSVDDNAINICFETTQGLHSDIFFVKENAMTFEDFANQKVVFISDEAHHLNADTKKGNAAQNADTQSWEQTINFIFKKNAENILLEFTATCDVKNAKIEEFYKDKIIFDYPLQKFYENKYSKDIISFKTNFKPIDKAFLALIFSQYRLKIFQEHRLNIKPIVLFKSLRIADSKNFMAEFLDALKNLDGNYLKKLLENPTLPITEKALEYFVRKGFDGLADELREDFSEIHCLSVNDDTDAEQKQILLNTLEDADNPYRAIFEVKKLDEGWDVLNLFDIVQLYEPKPSKNKKISATTISEAQLIGRGARYCPFQIDDEQPKFQRKYDSDVDNELRICETLLYHCKEDSNYILDLKRALKEIGLDLDKNFKCTYKLSESFRKSDFYQNGQIYLNRRIEKILPLKTELSLKETIFKFQIGGAAGLSNLMNDEEISKQVAVKQFLKTFSEIFAIVHKALRKFPAYKFNNLKKFFPHLKSTKDFITDKKFLGDVQIKIIGDKNITADDKLYAVCEVLKKISAEIFTPPKKYEGTREFTSRRLKDIFTDKTINISTPHKGGHGELQKVDAEWFAYENNFGTSEEKAFVKYFRDYYEDLKKIYDKIFLVRNERQFHIYSFDGRRFEPDFVIFLQKQNDKWQIFVEPKGEFLNEHDDWKEIFLLELKEKVIVNNDNYKILGFHFYNHDEEEIFDKDFQTLLSD